MTTKDEIRALFPALADAFKADYATFRGDHGIANNPAIAVYDVTFEEGSKFTRIVMYNGSQRSTIGFVCMVDTNNKGKQFKAGDLLKSAGWKAPALNFARGSILLLDSAIKNKNIRWTGLG